MSKIKEIKKATDLTPDNRNANRGTLRGVAMVEESFARNGAGRSVLADKNGKLIAGNKSANAFVNGGGDDVIVVQTDGTKLVVVQRTDLDLETDSKARELAYADNRTAQVGLDWSNVVLEEDRKNKDIDLDWMFRSDEMGDIMSQKSVFGDRKSTPFDDDDEEEDRGLGKQGDRRPGGVDIVVLCNSEAEAKKARREIQELGYYVK